MLTGLNITPEQLTEILRMFKVDMSEWGTPGHGTAQDLFSLIERGDAFLKISNRGLALSTQTARALIRNAQGKVLVCGNKNRQGLDNSDLQLGFSIPGGLIRGNSDARSTLERELLEEAGFKAEEYVVGNCVTQEGKRAHGAQPNLPIERLDHIFTVQLVPCHPVLSVERFEHLDSQDGALVFKWVPEEVWREKQRRKIHGN